MNGQPFAQRLALMLAVAGASFAAGRLTRPGRPAAAAGEPPELAEIRAALLQRGRGRRARTPTGIPAAGWKDVLLRIYDEIWRDRILSVGAGVAFYAILAIVPFITAFVSIYGLLLDPLTIEAHLAALRGLLPPEALTLLGDQLARLAAKPTGNLGFGFLLGLGIALWSSNAGMKAMVEALNVAYEEEEQRSFLRLNLVTLAFTLGAIVSLALLIALLVILPFALDFMGLVGQTDGLIRFARWPAILLLLIALLSLLYRYGPSRRRARWRWVTPGSLVAAAMFLAVSSLFSLYTTHLATYDETYGSLGSAIAFMTWLWLSAVVVLLGAELNAELEHQTLADSTVSPDRPIGTRQAVVADTVGRAVN